MPKSKSIYICSECGFESAKWYGKCPGCGEWNTMNEEFKEAVKHTASVLRPGESGRLKAAPILINEINTDDEQRYHTGLKELDRVLGGGIVKGSLVLLGGDPGIGKSTILLQVCQELGKTLKILYVSGEESKRQLKLRATRLGVNSDHLYILTETDVEYIIEAIRSEKPDLVIIDSIQTMSLGDLSSSPGSITQVRECTNAFMRTAKSLDIPILVVGHVNKDGAIAGPKVLEHIVDAVLYFEGDRHASYRILRAVKNRFGSTNEIGVFEMCNTGLEEVKNPSEYMLNGRPEDASGSVVACSMEGTRPILVEIQALVCQSNFGIPRRTAVGTDFNRVNLLMAVLEKKVGLRLAASDAYVNIAGGMKMTEPAIDLGICLAIVSSAKDIVIPDNVMVFGEVGLSGEIRAVSMAGQRVQEAKKLGFGTVVLPEVCKSSVGKVEGINLVYVSQIRDAIGYIMKK